MEIFISTSQYAQHAYDAFVIFVNAGLLGLIGFVIYDEYFDASRFSCPRDYLTPEEMEMINAEKP